MDPRESHQERLGEMAARAVASGYDVAGERFDAITGRARARFQERDWHGMLADMGERLELHAIEVGRVAARLRGMLGEPGRREPVWRHARIAYAALVAGRPDRELAETFFSSVSRRMLASVGVNAETEFDAEAFAAEPGEASGGAAGENPALCNRYSGEGGAAGLVGRILEDCRFVALYEDLPGHARLAGRVIDAAVAAVAAVGRPSSGERRIAKSSRLNRRLAASWPSLSLRIAIILHSIVPRVMGSLCVPHCALGV